MSAMIHAQVYESQAGKYLEWRSTRSLLRTHRLSQRVDKMAYKLSDEVLTMMRLAIQLRQMSLLQLRRLQVMQL